MIPISKPLMGPEEQAAVARVLETGFLASGSHVAEFERAFAAFVGTRHAIATSSGTTALHTALLAHGIGPGDEVIVTPFTFIASVNAILYCGAKPVFVDIDESFNLEATAIEQAITPRTRAILPVHLYGQPADMETIGAVARRYHLHLIEDACQAHGATFGGRHVGSFGTGCFSFYATKNMTTGEGGMITTDDDEVADRARQIVNHGMKVRYYHDVLGYNYRLTDIAAAIGLEQLKKLPSFNARRQEIAAAYDRALGDVPGIILPRTYPGRDHVYHQYTLRLTSGCRVHRDQAIDILKEKGVGTGVYYPIPVHHQKSIRAASIEAPPLPMAERMAHEVLSIPVHPGLTEADVDAVIAAIRSLRERR